MKHAAIAKVPRVHRRVRRYMLWASSHVATVLFAVLALSVLVRFAVKAVFHNDLVAELVAMFLALGLVGLHSVDDRWLPFGRCYPIRLRLERLTRRR